jgi:sulfatase maturation enzyme AslB (radical SAM superfamily)
MYALSEIVCLHLEISSKCNARCPLCPRNFYGFEHNDGYIEHNLTLNETQKIFSDNFIKQLTVVNINGNFGDAVMNTETVAIVKHFRTVNPSVEILISTNAGARNSKFWKDLARLNTKISFCIDGLSDTHSLYRQNTDYSVVLNNAKTFIDHGGHAIWKMIKFDHNQHQFDEAKLISQSMGFKSFQPIDHGRNVAPVFNNSKKLTHVIGKPKITDFETLWQIQTDPDYTVLLEQVAPNSKIKPISCLVKKQKSIYVSSVGDVFPCCFLGFSPKTYGHGKYHEPANKQFCNFVKENNALEYSLEHCIEWFNQIEKTWNIPTFEEGRLLICNDVCGVNSNT